MTLFGDGTEYVEIKRIDKAFETFKKTFESAMNPARYADTKADFVQLSRLRRVMGIATKEEPPDWEIACWNYMSSPMGAYSLKDLCSRYAVFVRSPLDRYNRPIGVGAYESRAEQQIRGNEEAARRVIERILGQAGQPAGCDVTRGTVTTVSRAARRIE